MAKLDPKHTYNMSFLIDIYIAAPHLFTGTLLHSTCRAARNTWYQQDGRTLYAEYKFAMLWAEATIGMHLNVFQWDKVNLISMKYGGDDLLTSHFYISENADFRYTVRIYNYNFLDRVVYYLSKYDLVNDIMITLDFATDVLSMSTAELFNHIGLFYYIYTSKSLAHIGFSVLAQHNDRPRQAFISNGYNNIPIQPALIDHNIFEIFEFMKTSRLNVGDYLPRYTISAT